MSTAQENRLLARINKALVSLNRADNFETAKAQLDKIRALLWNGQTKKEIEAELHGSERLKAIVKVLEVMADWMEFDDWLYAEEQRVWQPHWSRYDKIVDRLARIGASQKLIKEVGRRLAFMGYPILGKRLPPDLQKEIDMLRPPKNRLSCSLMH
jgi:hypothetical protein